MITLDKIYDLFLKYPLISTDTRNITPSSIFFALKGGNFNGNTFASEAIKLGAAISIVDEIKYEDIENNVFLVENCLLTLQNLASLHRSKFKIPVLGITGTNGKTTTKELIAAVISKKYKYIATLGNLNNHIGVPLTLLRINKTTEFAIIEMGANHIGEINDLCEIANPNYGIITNIGMAHLEGFGSFEGVIKTKTEMYKYIKSKRGMLFVNSGDELLTSLSKDNNQISYGASSENSAEVIDIDPTLNINVSYIKNGTKDNLEIHSNLAGKYNIDNILAAFSVGNFFNIKPADIRMAIQDYKPQNIRSQIKITESNKIIIDAYNANPTSMQKAIENFNEIKDIDKVLILGDMFELGSYSEASHREIIDQLEGFKFNNCYLVGSEFKKVIGESHFKSFNSTELLIEDIKKAPIIGKTILVKGSRGVGLEKVIEYL